ncbi:alpha/beta fold hydrolase [Brevibacterium casei]|uniref:Alpha/beta fold hydrolase n=1 Tax=Brevibacterium casei TaxID=33889 RepID=A0A165D0N8_9MICO|nr:alpha/beta fold hydrolase [Brevibacterium casei]KZE09969.1 esterase [Brevibacterium casei]MBE4694637.1 alpha/beta fold hydrolase [Brevibacterium casei]MBY3577759.1 alpha/beta fold hydrolase [Brevibacterium casei]MCT2182111.1 alpha/beta fold hydrolase [Brevibacterium casei]MCT2358627.1 alpha/beta fold hydrolase [Brevibacterium casei]
MNEIASRRIGDSGRLIVFLHGLFGRGKNFATVAKALTPEFSSLLVDLPDHGDSAWTDEFSYVATADAVASAIAEAVDPSQLPVHLVGHSLGGKVAMVLALRHPELVDRLVVVDIAPSGGGDVGTFDHLLTSLAELDLDTVSSRSEADQALQAQIPDPVVRGFLLQNLRPSAGGYSWQPNLTLLRESLPTIGCFPDPGELVALETGATTFDRPVLWVAGSESDYIDREQLPLMRSFFPRTTLLTVKGSGHWVHSEKPEAFVTAVRTFLTRPEYAG